VETNCASDLCVTFRLFVEGLQPLLVQRGKGLVPVQAVEVEGGADVEVASDVGDDTGVFAPVFFGADAEVEEDFCSEELLEVSAGALNPPC
jgi:hypothetical protein